MLTMEVKLSRVIVACARPSDKATYQNTCIPIALYDTMSFPWKWRPHGKANQIYVSYIGLAPYSVLIMLGFFPSYPQLAFYWMYAKAVNRNPEADCEYRFHKVFNGILQKSVPPLVWGRNVGVAESDSLFNGKCSYFTKVLLKIDACSWYLT